MFLRTYAKALIPKLYRIQSLVNASVWEVQAGRQTQRRSREEDNNCKQTDWLTDRLTDWQADNKRNKQPENEERRSNIIQNSVRVLIYRDLINCLPTKSSSTEAPRETGRQTERVSEEEEQQENVNARMCNLYGVATKLNLPLTAPEDLFHFPSCLCPPRTSWGTHSFSSKVDFSIFGATTCMMVHPAAAAVDHSFCPVNRNEAARSRTNCWLVTPQ